MDDLTGVLNDTSVNPSLGRYDPLPGINVGNMTQKLFEVVQNPIGALTGGGSEALLGDLQGMLQQQVFWQLQMQMINMESNVEKSRHECRMVPLRNISLR